jgi:hypothetical protein
MRIFLDKETREFIEKMFGDLNNKLDILCNEVKEIKDLQLNHRKDSNCSETCDESNSQVKACGENKKKEETVITRKKTTYPHFKTKLEKMNEDLLRLLK